MKLKLHKTTIHGAKTLKCNQCNKMFGYKKVLTEHIDNVHGIKDRRCLQVRPEFCFVFNLAKLVFTFQFLNDKIDQNTNFAKLPGAKWPFLVQP